MKKFILTGLLSLPLIFLAQINKQHSPEKLKLKALEKLNKESKRDLLLPALSKVITIGSQEYDLVKANGTLDAYKLQHKVTKSNATSKVTYHYNNKVATSTLTPCDPIGVSVTAVNPFPLDPQIDDETYLDANGSNLQLPFTFCFYGNSYTSVNYSTNGNIQLGSTNVTAFSSVGFPVTNTLMIAPFWADLDNRAVGQYFVDVFPTYAVFTWTNCGYYNSKSDKTNSFQLVISDGLDPILPPGKNVGFYYYNMQWTTGDFGGNGTNGFPTTQPGIPATVGINSGNGIDFIQLGRFGLPSSFYDGPGGSNDGVAWLNGKKFYFNVCPASGTNIDPQSSLVSCDTLKVCGDDTLRVVNSFLAPEIGQNVTVTVSAPTLGSALSFTIVPNSGSTDVALAIDGLNATNGYHIITISATDNGAPALTITQELVVSVNETVPTASIFGAMSYCLPSQMSTVLTASNVSTSPNQSPLTYSWSGTGSLSSTSSDVVTVNNGVYTVTITNQFGCPAVATATVVKGETPNYSLISNAISGGSVYCVNQDSARIGINFGGGSSASCGLANTPCVTSTTVQVGTGTTTGSGSAYTPYNGFWESAHHQYLYRASELLAAGVQPGKISSIAFNLTNINGGNTSYANFVIKLKCTSSNVLTNTSMDVVGLYQVFSTPQLNVSTGWNTHNFSQSYVWDGVSNLLVDVCYFDLNWDDNNTVQYTNVGYNAVRNDYDISDICGTTSVAGVSQNRPNTRFGNCLAQQTGSQFNVVVTPTTGVVIPAAHDSIRIDLPSTSGTTCYTVSLINPIGNCSKDTVICVNALQGVTQGTLSINSTSVCPSGTVTLSASGALTSYTIQYIDDAGVQTTTLSPVTFTAPSTIGAYTYTLLATGACGGPLTSFTNTLNVVQGVTQATLVSTPSVVCIGSPVTLTANGSLATYTISYNNGSLVNSVNNSATFNTAISGLNVYTLTAQGLCSAPVTNFTTSVMVNSLATLTIAPMANVTKCLNSSVTLTANVLPASTSYSYNWSPSVGTFTNNTYSSSAIVTTTYVVTVNGFCANTATASVVVSNYPNDMNVQIIDSASVCANTELVLHSLTTGGRPPYTYNWTILPNTNSIGTTANLNTIAPSSEGTYTIMVLSTDDCGFTDFDNQVVVVLPSCEIVIANIITPNEDGANDFFKIKNIEYHPNSSLTIFDRWGKKVYENKNYANEWKADGLNDGTYFYVLDVPDDKKYNGFVQVAR